MAGAERPPGWHPDPHGRAPWRYWNGSEWTSWIHDGEQPSSEQSTSPTPPPTDTSPVSQASTARRRSPLVVGTALVVAVALVAGFWWSRRGDGDVSDGPDNTEPAVVSTTASVIAPTLRPATASPGRAVMLMHPSLIAGQTTTVTITDGDTVIEYPLTPSSDGAVTLVAPPWVDAATGQPGPGAYDVSVAGSATETLSIGELPEPLEGPPGSVTRAVLAQARTDLDASGPALDRLRDEFGLDTAELAVATEAMMADLDAQLAEFDVDGTLQLAGGPSGTVVLTGGDLELMDRLLTGYIVGLVEQLEARQGVQGFAARLVGDEPTRADHVENATPPSTTQEWLDHIRRLRAQITGGATVLTGGAAMLVTAIAVLYGSAAFGASALFAFLAGVGTTVVIGSAAEALAAAEAWLTGKNWEFGAVFADTMLEAFLNLGVSIGAEVSALVNLGSFLYTGSQVRNGLYDLVCSTRPIPEAYRDFCEQQESNNAAAGPVALNKVWFSPELIPPGRSGTLFVALSKGRAREVSINVNWGTGDPDDTITVTKSGLQMFRHAFADDLDGQLVTIEVHAIDDNLDEVYRYIRVAVTREVGVDLDLTKVPVQMTTLNGYTWDLELVHGQKEYTISADFGDGTGTTTVKRPSPGSLTFDHTYEQAGQWPVRIDVTDGLGDSASVSMTAEVRDPVALTIDGPAALDPNEVGNWSFEIEPGWGPYELEVNWGDGSEPDTSTVEGTVALTHAYTDRASYTITAFVTSAVSLSADAALPVEVGQAVSYGDVEFPKGEISFADRVVEYIPGEGAESPYDSGARALGPPDDTFTALGNSSATCESSVTFEFVDNYLTDVPGPDLWVFEVGPAVEATDLFISNDLASWIELGRIEGSTRSVDISGSVAPGEVYRYVRLCDHPDGNTSPSPYAGPDIDAVGAIGTVERPVDER